MAKRPFLFRDETSELRLPITPGSYTVSKGTNIEVINIHELGDVILVGYGTLATIKINCMLPNPHSHFFTGFDAGFYVEQFSSWIDSKTAIRFIVGNTGVNIPVRVQEISGGEQDGTNDVYLDITLREFREMETIEIQIKSKKSNKARASMKVPSSSKNYQIIYGDTLSAICRREYGDGSKAVYDRLAAFNGIANPHLIYAGNSLKLPQPLP